MTKVNDYFFESAWNWKISFDEAKADQYDSAYDVMILHFAPSN